MKQGWTKNVKNRLGKSKTEVILFSVIFAVLMALGSTLAWFTAVDTRTNEMKAEQYDFNIKAVDVFTEPDTPVNPGDDPVEKIVGAANKGTLPGFVRLLALPVIVASDGVTVLPANMGAQLIADINTTQWKYGGDGYYYYLDVLEPGEETPPLFTQVQLADTLGDEYKNATFKIEVKCEASGIEKWDYRIGWWGSENPPADENLAAVDNVLQLLAQ